ncbi:MAG TPA: HEAT repeat domain-containing protein [Terriglobia bacterium]|jgi:HEAT repeat protein
MNVGGIHRKLNVHCTKGTLILKTRPKVWTTPLILASIYILLPAMGFLSFSQAQRVDSAPSAFVKGEATRQTKIAQDLIRRGKGAVPDALLLLDSPDIQIQAAALVALGRIGDSGTLSKVSRKIASPSALVRATAAAALGDLGDKGATSVLLSTVNDPDPSVRIQTILALAKLKVPELEPVMKAEAIRAEASAGERQAAIVGLGNIKSIRAVGDLILIATNAIEQEHTRSAAIAALGAIGDKRAVRPIVKLLNDPSDTVRFNAAASLGTLGGSDAEEGLIRLLRDPNQPNFIRIRAIGSIRSLGTDAGTQELFRISREEGEFIAMHAVRALVITGAPGGKAAALELKMRSKDAFVRSIMDRLIVGDTR